MRHWQKDENNESERGKAWKEILSTVRWLLDISVCRVISTRFDTFPRLDIFLIVYRYLRSIAGAKYKIPFFFWFFAIHEFEEKFPRWWALYPNIEIRSINFFWMLRQRDVHFKNRYFFSPPRKSINLGISCLYRFACSFWKYR